MKLNSAASLTAIALLVISGLTPQRTWSADEREVVMQVTQRACDAFRMADIASVERLLAPEFTLVSSDASVQTRAEVLAEVRNGDPKYEVFRNHSMTAHVFGDAAIVQGITSLKGTSGGKPFATDVRFTDTLIKSRGEWRLVVSHVTRMPTSGK
jgi:ketosteroid isomerase-like protein